MSGHQPWKDIRGVATDSQRLRQAREALSKEIAEWRAAHPELAAEDDAAAVDELAAHEATRNHGR
jgi:hypothetical protein